MEHILSFNIPNTTNMNIYNPFNERKPNLNESSNNIERENATNETII